MHLSQIGCRVASRLLIETKKSILLKILVDIWEYLMPDVFTLALVLKQDLSFVCITIKLPYLFIIFVI